MVDKEMVLDRLALIKKSLEKLKELGQIPEEEFLVDEDCFAIAEHHLRRALEAVLDIGRHICVHDKLGQPEDYTGILELLGQKNILEKDFMQRIKGMAGYRNRLVHMYNQVSTRELYTILQTRLDDFAEFIAQIMKYIKKDGS
jgi:uncharacterized protein YutE (UPF0331/DUF86 family)